LMGGLLESPADKFGSTFGRIRFFHDYPYALPGFASACLGLSAAILTALFVKEVRRIFAYSTMMLIDYHRLCTFITATRSPTNPGCPCGNC
jgi:hypothetical protein